MTAKPIRVLVAKPGLDGHDVGAKLVCRALRDAGFEVIYTGLRQSPEAIAKAAMDEDVDAVALSILSGAHLPLTRKVKAAFETAGISPRLFVGGNIPEQDRKELAEIGVSSVFPVGTPFPEIVAAIDGREEEAVREGGKEEARQAPPKAPTKAPPKAPTEASATSLPEGLSPVVWESGLEVKPVYTEEDFREAGGASPIGEPGGFPFTRGIHPYMYRQRPFTMRQYSGFGTAAETHERFLYLIEHGQTGLNVAFDLPTQCGLDSDDEMAEGEVGRVGMAVDTLSDMEEAFAGIDLNKITVSLTINGAAAPIMAMYFAMAKKRGFDLQGLRGTAQNDILKEFVGRGTWIYPVNESVRLVGDTIEFCAKNVPRYSAVSVCGYHIRESGADPAQEMAYGLSIATAYIDHVLARGLDIDRFARGLSFNFDIHGNLFEQVAKFRAGRRLYARIMKETYGAKKARSMQLRMIAGGGGGGLTIEEPENNIVRGAYYALVSALSGTQTMALCSYDEAYTIPSKHAALLSLRTMQILMQETGVCDTVDPLAGSFFVESMTTAMEKRIEAIMAEVEQEGGILDGIATGRVQAEVNRSAYERELALRAGTIKKVGVNCYRDETPSANRSVEFHPYREEEANRQIERLRKVKQDRSNEAVARTLDEVRRVAGKGENVMPAILEAVTAYATVGEVSKALKDVFGAYREPVRF